MDEGSMEALCPMEANMDVDRLKASTYVMTSTVESSPDVCLAISFNRLCGSVKFLIYQIIIRIKTPSVTAADEDHPANIRSSSRHELQHDLLTSG